ncbi:MAG: SDR family oxidoreductase [Acidobacteriia bacterium]|nr:SDR family oxidoreductase [Terriglobia bacterium]
MLTGKIAIVTGASRGIGRAIAETFARAGASVVICGRKQETLDRVAAEMGGAPGAILPLACHVGRADDVRRMVEETHRAFGKVDILVNNAGTNVAWGPALEIDEERFDKMIEINLKSAFRLIQAVAPGMCRRSSGSIVNIASIAGLRPLANSMVYNVTKAALIMMTQSYALELGPKGVRVNAIAPGFVETALSEHYWKGEDRRVKLVEQQPIRHLGQPGEVAEMALLLASDRGSYITGQTMVVDGGRLIS